MSALALTPASPIAEMLFQVQPFLISLPRLATLFVMIPLFGRRTVRGIIRNEFIVVLALFVYPMAAASPDARDLSAASLVALSLKEALIGVILGFLLGTVFWVAENVGYLVDLQTGLHNASVFDPLREQDDGPASSFMLQFVIALVLAGGGLLSLLEIVFESYRVWPIRSASPDWGAALSQGIGMRADNLLAQTLRFAAPVIVLLLLVEAGMGLVNRFADQLDVYSLAMPVKAMVAFFVLLVFASFIYDSIRGLMLFDAGILRELSGAIGVR